jgi:HPr kinase/phosphorylase
MTDRPAMSAPVNIHASCVVLADAGDRFGAPRDAGVLILGESGAGKSDLALRLIAEGAVLVADDRCEMFVEDDMLFARASAALAGLIEVRGVGVISMRFMPRARIGLAVRLVQPATIARLPHGARYEPPKPLGATPDIWPPEIAVAPFEPSAPAKVAAGAAAFAGALFRQTDRSS